VFRLRQAAELAPADMRVRGNLVLALAASGDAEGARRLLAGIPDQAERAAIEAELARRGR
jgi:Flp pilus assembly protein TadD